MALTPRRRYVACSRPRGYALILQGLFYIGSALALVSALITFLFVPNIKADAMRDEEVLVSLRASCAGDSV